MVSTSDVHGDGNSGVRGGVRLMRGSVDRHEMSHGTVANPALSPTLHTNGSHLPLRGSERGMVASGQEDCAAGSALHTAWLERQLSSRHRSHASQ